MMLSDFTHQFFEGQWKLDDIPEVITQKRTE